MPFSRIFLFSLTNAQLGDQVWIPTVIYVNTTFAKEPMKKNCQFCFVCIWVSDLTKGIRVKSVIWYW